MSYRCDHLHLRSRDAVGAARFYVEALGARETGRVGEPVVTRVMLDLAGLTLFIEQAPDAKAAAEPPHLGIEHIGLKVPDLDAALADMRRRGVRIVEEAKVLRPDLKIAFLEGPDGVRIELLQRG